MILFSIMWIYLSLWCWSAVLANSNICKNLQKLLHRYIRKSKQKIISGMHLWNEVGDLFCFWFRKQILKCVFLNKSLSSTNKKQKLIITGKLDKLCLFHPSHKTDITKPSMTATSIPIQNHVGRVNCCTRNKK